MAPKAKPKKKDEKPGGAKGTPKEEPDQPPPPDPDEIKRSIAEFSNSILEDLLLSTFDQIKEKYLQSREVPFTVDRVIGDMLCILEWSFVSHDPGEGNQESDCSWLVDYEPEPTAVDSWARGVLPVKKRFKFETLSSQMSALSLGLNSLLCNRKGVGGSLVLKPGEISRPHSAASSIPLMSTRSDRSAKSTLSPNSARNKKPTLLQMKNVKQLPIGSFRQVASAVIYKARLLHKVNLESSARASREDATRDSYRDEMAAREHAEMVQKKLTSEFKAETERYEKMKRELSGKEWSYDHDFNPIIINPLHPDKLPPQTINLKVCIGPRLDNDVQQSASTAHTRRASARAPAAAAPHAHALPEGIVLKAAPTHPPLMDTITVATGVTLRDGDQMKPGPKSKPDAHHMTKREFGELFKTSSRRNSTQMIPLTIESSSDSIPQPSSSLHPAAAAAPTPSLSLPEASASAIRSPIAMASGAHGATTSTPSTIPVSLHPTAQFSIEADSPRRQTIGTIQETAEASWPTPHAAATNAPMALPVAKPPPANRTHAAPGMPQGLPTPRQRPFVSPTRRAAPESLNLPSPSTQQNTSLTRALQSSAVVSPKQFITIPAPSLVHTLNPHARDVLGI